MNIRTHIIYIIVIIVVVIVAVIGFSRPQKFVENIVERRDTTIITKIDTIVNTDVRYIEKTIVDTIYVTTNESGFGIVPMYDYHFKKEGRYDIWAYGHGVIVRNVTVYPMTRTVYVNKTIEKEVIQKKWDCYLGLEISALNDKVIPNISIAVKTPNRWLLTASLGYCDIGIQYGLGIMYRLGK